MFRRRLTDAWTWQQYWIVTGVITLAAVAMLIKWGLAGPREADAAVVLIIVVGSVPLLHFTIWFDNNKLFLHQLKGVVRLLKKANAQARKLGEYGYGYPSKGMDRRFFALRDAFRNLVCPEDLEGAFTLAQLVEESVCFLDEFKHHDWVSVKTKMAEVLDGMIEALNGDDILKCLRLLRSAQLALRSTPKRSQPCTTEEYAALEVECHHQGLSAQQTSLQEFDMGHITHR